MLETSLYVDDLDAARKFYRDVLGLELHSSAPQRHIFFRCGRGMLLLFDPDATAQPGSDAPHGARGPGHVAFAIDPSDLDAWRARLAGRGVAVEHEATWPTGARSLYFRDPAGNSLELASPGMWGIPD